MNDSSLQHAHTMTTMRMHSWPLAVYMADDNSNGDLEWVPGSLAKPLWYFTGWYFLWKANTPWFFETSSTWWRTPPARPPFPPLLSSLPVTSHLCLSAPLHTRPAASVLLPSPPTLDGNVLHCFPCMSAPHCPPEIRCQKIRVHTALFHGQMSSLIHWHKHHLVVFL